MAKSRNKGHPNSSGQPGNDQPKTVKQSTAPVVENLKSKVPGDSNQQTKKDEKTSYDKVIARWTRILGVSTVILAIATIGSAYVLLRTDETLRETLIWANRAWLSIKPEIAGSLDFKDGVITPTLDIVLINEGRSPASSIYVYAVADEASKIPQTFSQRQESLCREYLDLSPGIGVGETIFPSERTKKQITKLSNMEKLKDAPARFIICTIYQTSFDPLWRRATFPNDPSYRLTSKVIALQWSGPFPVSAGNWSIKILGSFAN